MVSCGIIVEGPRKVNTWPVGRQVRVIGFTNVYRVSLVLMLTHGGFVVGFLTMAWLGPS